jgi:uncharacterized protein (DUF885 family)
LHASWNTLHLTFGALKGEQKGWGTITDRYIAVPAQALGYKIGQLEILKLRQYSKDQLGDKFSLSNFHDEVLAAGALPLDVLSTRIHEWVATQKGSASSN